MPGRADHTALVMGDGLAGLGAAIVLARAGWRVALARNAADRRTHRHHAHLAARDVLQGLEKLTGGALDGWQMGVAAAWDATGRRDNGPRAIVAAEALRGALMRRSDGLRVSFLDDTRLAPQRDERGWAWQAQGDAGTAALLVDASGSGHLLGRLPGRAVAIDELEGLDRCWSWTGTNDGPATPWLLCARSDADSAVLMRGPDGVIRLTLRGECDASPDPIAALDKLLLGAGAAWAARIGTIALDPRPLRHDCPLARRSTISEVELLPPMVRIGDALIQTAPRLGQGIAQITEQLAALKAGLSSAAPPRRLQDALDVLANRRWAGLMMLAGLGRIAA